MAVITQNKAYALHHVGCTEVDRRNKKLKRCMTFVEHWYGNQLAKFGKGNLTLTSYVGGTPPLE